MLSMWMLLGETWRTSSLACLDGPGHKHICCHHPWVNAFLVIHTDAQGDGTLQALCQRPQVHHMGEGLAS